MLRAAHEQFCERGYGSASVDTIAAASGVSKVTIYSYFPTKADLFQASINQRVETQLTDIDWSSLDPAKPREALMLIGRAFLTLMCSDDAFRRQRALCGTQGLDPAVAESYYAAGPQKLAGAIAKYLGAASKARSLQMGDASLAADQFLSLFLGLGQIRAVLGLRVPTKREDDDLLKANVQLFIRGHSG